MTPRVRKFRVFVTLALALACGGASAPACDRGRGAAVNDNGRAATPTPTAAAAAPSRGGEVAETPMTTDGELKLIGEGAYSRVSESFVAVARDAETYAALRQLHEGLPQLGADFFEANAVVAAFLGQRRSGGFAVGITRGRDGTLRLSESAPPPDAITTMALTAPFRVVSFAHSQEHPVRLALAGPWQEQARPYRVAGEFTMTGGFAGVREPFKVAGTLGVLRYQNLATVLFDLKGEGGGKPRALADAATGTVDGSRQLSVARLDPGTFILTPRRAMRAVGRFSEGEGKLSLSLEATQTAVADGFNGRGTLEAEATGPPPPKRAPDDERM